MATVSQDVLVQFAPGKAISSVAGYYVSNEGTQHVIVGFVDGSLTEGYWRSGQGVHQNTLATFPHRIVDVGGYFNPAEASQHAIVGTDDNALLEPYSPPHHSTHHHLFP